MEAAIKFVQVSSEELDARIEAALERVLARRGGGNAANDTKGFTTKQVAEKLGIKQPKTIVKWCTRDGCPHTRLPGNEEIRLDLDEVEAWLRDRAVQEGAHTTRRMEQARRLKKK